MSSRSSTFCSPLGASRRASGGCAQAPFRFAAIFSAGSFSGSDSGSVGSIAAGAGRLIDGGVGRDAAARSAAAAAPTMAAAREGFGASSARGLQRRRLRPRGKSRLVVIFVPVLQRRRRSPDDLRILARLVPALSGFLSRCFFSTSCRCFSRRRSSLRARIASSEAGPPIASHLEHDGEQAAERELRREDDRQEEQGQDQDDRPGLVQVLGQDRREHLRRGSRRRESPGCRPASVPNASDRNEETQPKSRPAPTSFV